MGIRYICFFLSFFFFQENEENPGYLNLFRQLTDTHVPPLQEKLLINALFLSFCFFEYMSKVIPRTIVKYTIYTIRRPSKRNDHIIPCPNFSRCFLTLNAMQRVTIGAPPKSFQHAYSYFPHISYLTLFRRLELFSPTTPSHFPVRPALLYDIYPLPLILFVGLFKHAGRTTSMRLCCP